MSRTKVTWIGDEFDNDVIRLPDETEWQTQWQIGQKISEKCAFFEARLWRTGADMSESQAVYHCHQVAGPCVGKEAIMKIRMQYGV